MATGKLKLSMPSLGGLRVYIEGNCSKGAIIRMMARADCQHAEKISEADLVIFSGGADVNPALYKEKQHPTTNFSKERDVECEVIFNHCLKNDIPMLGICRGMQFLHVMHGGKLYQNVTNHAGNNHNIVDLSSGNIIEVSSGHHQMCVEDPKNKNTFALAYAIKNEGGPVTGKIERPSYSWTVSNQCDLKELEATIYVSDNPKRTVSLGVQGHPEWGPEEFTQWTLNTLMEMLYEKKAIMEKTENKTLTPSKLKVN